MSYYGAYGATAGLTVVGLCTLNATVPQMPSTNKIIDLLFTGDGEAFNVTYTPEQFFYR